jgi:hypothetical protein
MIKKAIAKFRKGEVSVTDIVRFAYTSLQRLITGATGTAAIYFKSKLLGIEIGAGVVCFGKIDIMPAMGSRIKDR